MGAVGPKLLYEDDSIQHAGLYFDRPDGTESWANERYFKEYVLAYTNASTIVNEKFEDTEDLGGYFSGFDQETGTYDPATWMYEGGEIASAAGRREHHTQSFEARTKNGDRTFQLMRGISRISRRSSQFLPGRGERGFSAFSFGAIFF